MNKKRIAALIGMGAGAIGAVVLAKHASQTNHMPTSDATTVSVESSRGSQVESVVTEVVETLADTVSEDVEIYADYGPNHVLSGNVDESELGLNKSADIVIKGPIGTRAIIVIGLDEDMHEYSESLLKRLNGLKKQSYARILLVENGPTDIAEWIADDAEGTVVVEETDEVQSAIQ